MANQTQKMVELCNFTAEDQRGTELSALFAATVDVFF